MTRVLVTGARGFIGQHVLATLAAAGFDVHGVSSAAASADGTCTWHQADLLDAAQRRALVARVRASALLHLAWCAKPPGYWSDPQNLQWVGASLDLAAAFAEHGGARIVGVGTCAEYDWQYGYCTERETPLTAATLYGASKAACGTVLDAFGRQTGLSTAWGRLFFLFGPHDSPLRLIPSLVRDLKAGRPARCLSGRHVRDFLHVSDAAAALVALLRSDVTGPVNIASGVPVRLSDLARQVAAAVGRTDLLSVDDGSSEQAVVLANVARLRDEVGWCPPRDNAAALDETVRWWCSAAAHTEVNA